MLAAGFKNARLASVTLALASLKQGSIQLVEANNKILAVCDFYILVRRRNTYTNGEEI